MVNASVYENPVPVCLNTARPACGTRGIRSTYVPHAGRSVKSFNEGLSAYADPLSLCLTFFFLDPRATPDARLAFGAAFLRAARFSVFRSALSSNVFRIHSSTLIPAYFSIIFFNP